MAEYIERDAVIKLLQPIKGDGIPTVCVNNALAIVKYAVNRINAADVAPVVHGRWEYYSTTMMECSNCKRHTARHKFSYCPHCGAAMEDKYYL